MLIKDKSETGFTLVELILVIVLIGILAVVVVPKLSTSGFEERGYYDRLVSALRYAQKYAVAQRCGSQVTITAARFDVFRPVSNAACAAVITTPVLDPGNRSINFAGTTPSGVMVSPATTVVFDSLGRAGSGATITVGARTITVVGESGLVF